MAEGGFDDYEMGEFNPLKFPEYDDMSNEDLRLKVLDLRNNLVNGDGDLADLTERIRYIEDKLAPSIEETSFVDGDDGTAIISTGGEGELGVPSVIPSHPPTVESQVTAVDKFIQDTHGVRVDWGSAEGMRLRSRLGLSKESDITLKRYITRGDQAKQGNTVLKRDSDQTFRYNKGGPIISSAVNDLKNAIGKLVEQAKSRDEKTRGMDMVDTNHIYTPRRGLTDQENREYAGVLSPSRTIDKRTRSLL